MQYKDAKPFIAFVRQDLSIPAATKVYWRFKPMTFCSGRCISKWSVVGARRIFHSFTLLVDTSPVWWYNELDPLLAIGPQFGERPIEDSYAIIAHELRHVWQALQGWWIDKGNRNILWKGKPYIFPETITDEYDKLPWEVDAIEYEKEALAKWKQKSEQ